jgi:NADPH-dependent F420 reductase
MNSPILLTIGILGGTGKEGKGLAYRWAKAGYRILIGSRHEERARSVASELTDLLSGKAVIDGQDNAIVAKKADLVVLTVPYSAHRQTLESVREELQGKILIDVTVPLVPPKTAKVQMPPAGSAAQEACQILGEGVQVASAFQTISYTSLLRDEDIQSDVLVTGTSKEARSETLKLVEAAGLVGWDAGPIENSMVVEGLTSLLIGINKQYGTTSAGIRISGIPRTIIKQ